MWDLLRLLNNPTKVKLNPPPAKEFVSQVLIPADICLNKKFSKPQLYIWRCLFCMRKCKKVWMPAGCRVIFFFYLSNNQMGNTLPRQSAVCCNNRMGNTVVWCNNQIGNTLRMGNTVVWCNNQIGNTLPTLLYDVIIKQGTLFLGCHMM